MSAATEPKLERSEVTPVARKAYPGVVLRHLGSVRDVTLAKTHGPKETVGTRPSKP